MAQQAPWINGAWTTISDWQRDSARYPGTGTGLAPGQLLGNGYEKGIWVKGLTEGFGICKGYPFDFFVLLSSYWPQMDGIFLILPLAQISTHF